MVNSEPDGEKIKNHNVRVNPSCMQRLFDCGAGVVDFATNYEKTIYFNNLSINFNHTKLIAVTPKCIYI